MHETHPSFMRPRILSATSVWKYSCQYPFPTLRQQLEYATIHWKQAGDIVEDPIVTPRSFVWHFQTHFFATFHDIDCVFQVFSGSKRTKGIRTQYQGYVTRFLPLTHAGPLAHLWVVTPTPLTLTIEPNHYSPITHATLKP